MSNWRDDARTILKDHGYTPKKSVSASNIGKSDTSKTFKDITNTPPAVSDKKSKNKGTAAAKLPEIGSNSFENIPTYKEQKKAYKDNTAAEFKTKYGVDMSEFKQSDYYKWANEHGFVFMHADQAGLSESPRMGAKHSEEDIAEEKRLRYLLQYNNRREELEQDKNGAVKAAASGARNSIAFNTFKRLENWADKNDSLRKHGKYVNALSEEYKANLADIDTQYEQNHPTAKAVGEGAADLAKLAALQGAVGKIIDGVGWLASKPQWVIRAVKDGLTFGIKNGLDSAGRGDDAKTVARNTGIGTVGGAAGGTAAHFTGAALENVLFRYGLQNKVIPEIIRNGTAAANFSLADTASTYFLHPENERPSAQEIAKNAGVAFAFASITTAVHTSEIKANSKQTLDNLDKNMTASYEEMLRAAVEKDGVNTKKFAQNVIDYTEAMERYLDGKGVEILEDNAASSTVGEYLVEQGKVEPKTNETVLEKARFVGEDSRVRSIKSDLQEIRSRAQDYLTKADAIVVDGKVTDTPLEIEGGSTTNTEPIHTEQVTTPKAEPLQTVNHEISPQAQKITAGIGNEYKESNEYTPPAERKTLGQTLNENREYIINSKPVANYNRIDKTPSAKQIKSNILESYKQRYRYDGQYFHIPTDNGEVLLRGELIETAADKYLHLDGEISDYEAQLIAGIYAIPDVIQNGKELGGFVSDKGYNSKYIGGLITIDGAKGDIGIAIRDTAENKSEVQTVRLLDGQGVNINNIANNKFTLNKDGISVEYQNVNYENNPNTISPMAKKITAELGNKYNVGLVGTGNKIDEAYKAIHDNPHSDKNAMTAWEISSEIGRGIAQGIKADNVEETGNNIAARIFEKLFEDMSVGDNADTDSASKATDNETAVEPQTVQTTGRSNGGFIDDREYAEVGKRNVNAFQYDNPEVKPFYKAAANELLSDISSTVKGQKVYISSSNMANGTPDRVTGQKRLTSESIAKIKDVTGASYDQIKDALTRLINDHGQENIALAKRVELVIDDMLTDGYTDFNGNKIPPNEEYIAVKNNLSAPSTQTAETQPGMTDYRAGLVTENITKGMNTKTGAPSRADNIQSANSRIQSDSSALFDRDFVRAYVKDFLIGMAQKNSSAFNALKQMDGYVGEELIKEVIYGNAAPEYKNNNYFRQTAEELKKVLVDAAEKNVIMHNRTHGESERLNHQLEAIRNGDFSVVDMNEYGFAEVPDGQKAPGLIQDDYSSRLTGEETTALDSIGKTIGVPIKVINSIKLNNANGCYHNGVVYVSLEAQDKPMVVFSHEVTHYLENTPGYEAYKDAVMDVMARSGGKYETELINEKIRAYTESGIQLTREDAVHEIVADYTRNILNSPEDAMEYVNGIENENQKRTVIQAFCDAIKKLLAKIKGIFNKPPQYVKDLQTTQSLFEDMLKEAASGEFVETGDASRTAFSPIEYDADGNPFVRIDEDILDGVAESEKRNTVRKYILDHFQTINVNGENIIVNAQSRGEYTNSKSARALERTDKTAYDDKLRAAHNLDEIVQAQQNIKPEGIKHERKDSIVDFEKGEVTIKVGDNTYNASVLIGIRNDGSKMLYDLTEISKKNTGVVPRVSSQDANNSGRNQQPVSSKLSISENGENVKHLANENNGNEDIKTSLSAAGEGIEKVNPEYSISDKAAPIDKQPARDTETPKTVTKAQYVSRFARTAVEAGEAPTAAVSEFEKEILDGTMLHEEIRDKEAKANVEKLINSKGFQAAMDAWDVLINGGKTLSDDDMALGQELYNRSILNKDVTNAVKIAAELSTQTAKSGQNPHMVSILNKLPPDGRLYYLERSVKEINRDYKNKLGDKHKDIRLNEDLMKRFLKADTEEARNDVYDEICLDIADQIPTTNMDRWNAWRYLSMLGNAKTHIRNIVGNAVFYPTVRIKSYMNAAAEKVFVEKENRTTSFTKTKESKAYAAKDFELVKKELQGINAKYAVTSDIESKRRIFQVGALEFLRKKNGDLLEAEDLIFLKSHYEDAFARVMTARGITAEQLDGDTNWSKIRLNKIREIAMKEAQEATYRDANAVADVLNDLQRRAEKSKSRAKRVGGIAIEAVMPFKKTPLNIAKRGVEYSPIGLINGIGNVVADVKKEKKVTSETINKISKGVVGTGITILGYWLASMGVITGAGDEDEKKKKFDSMIGKQNYALNIGDKSYTIDWMAPAAMPLFIGVELYGATHEKQWTFAKVVNALSTISEPLLELSCLSGISSTIQAAQFNEHNVGLAIMENMATSYLTQGVPTFWGQLARAIDRTKRNAYYKDKESQLPTTIQTFIGQVAAKVPGASKLLEPKIDMWGREEDYGELAERLIENGISPGYYSQEQYTDVDKELERLYKSVGGNKMFPPKIEKYTTIDGVKYNFNVHQYTQFARLRGQKSFELVEDLMNDNIRRKKQGAQVATTVFYDGLDDDEKVEQIQKCYDDALDYAKEEIQPMLE